MAKMQRLLGAHFDEFVAGWQRQLSQDEVQAVEEVLPVGWAQGDRYNAAQWTGPERYC